MHSSWGVCRFRLDHLISFLEHTLFQQSHDLPQSQAFPPLATLLTWSPLGHQDLQSWLCPNDIIQTLRESQASLPPLILLGVAFSFSAHKKPAKNISFGRRLESSSPRHDFQATSKPRVTTALRSCQETWSGTRSGLGTHCLEWVSFPRQGLRGHRPGIWAPQAPSGAVNL